MYAMTLIKRNEMIISSLIKFSPRLPVKRQMRVWFNINADADGG